MNLIKVILGFLILCSPFFARAETNAPQDFRVLDSYIPKANPLKSACKDEVQEESDRDIVSYKRDPIIDWSCIPEKIADYHDGMSDKVVKINETFNNPVPPLELRYDKKGLDEMYKKMNGRYQNGAPILPISRLHSTPGNILHAAVNRLVDTNGNVGIFFDKHPEEFVKFTNKIKVVRLVYDDAAAPDMRILGDNLVFYVGLNLDYQTHDIKLKSPGVAHSNWFDTKFSTIWPPFAQSSLAPHP